MLHSKATAALMRLKEIDRKYKVRQADGSRLGLNMSTESSPSSVERDLRRSEEHQQQLPEAPPKLKTSRLDVQMPEARFEPNKNDEPDDADDDEERESEKSSSILVVNVSSRTSEDRSVRSDESVATNDPKPSSAEIRSSVAEVYEVSEVAERIGEESEKFSEPGTVASVDEEDGYTVTNGSHRSGTKTSGASRDSHVKLSPDLNAREKAVTTDEASIAYENDTFEETSSATLKASISKARRERRILSETSDVEEKFGGPEGVKRTKISPRVADVPGSSDTEVIELVSPKIAESTSQLEIDLNKELSDYVRKIEETDTDPTDVSPVRLLKSSRSPQSSASSASKIRKKPKRNNKSVKRDTLDGDKTTTASSSISSRKQSLTNDSDKVKEKEDSARKIFGKDNSSESKVRPDRKVDPANPKAVSKKKKEQVNKCDKIERKGEREFSKHGDSMRVQQEAELKRPIIKFELNRDLNEHVEARTVDADIDVTRVLRKLNRDAINAVSGHSAKSRHPSGGRRSSKNHSDDRNNVDRSSAAPILTKISKSNENFVRHEHFAARHEKARTGTSKKKRAKIKAEKKRKSVKRPAQGEKHIKFDSKHVRRLKKQIAALRLQQDRENVRNYLRELKATRSGLGLSDFSPEGVNASELLPLQFPKIAAFSQPDRIPDDLVHHDEIGGLRQRLLIIRQWIKDQYILYRDYCNLAQIINTEYVPTNLIDVKKTVYELKKTTAEIR